MAGPRDHPARRAPRRPRAWMTAPVPVTAAGAPVRGMSAAGPRGPTYRRASRRRGRPRRGRARHHGRAASARAHGGRVAQPGPAARRRRACVVRMHQAHRTVRRALSFLVVQQRLHAPVTHAANLRCCRGRARCLTCPDPLIRGACPDKGSAHVLIRAPRVLISAPLGSLLKAHQPTRGRREATAERVEPG
jgi:hypothetical protein